METEKPRWHKALDNLKQFTSLQARLESELSDAHRELSKVRDEYLQLGLRCSALASERDELRQRVSETEQYVEALHTEPEAASPVDFDAGAELHQQLTSLHEEVDQSQRRYAEMETEFLKRGQKIEALQDRVAANQARETELVAELQLLRQRLGSVEQDSSDSNEKYRALLLERDSLRLDIADTAVRHHQQIEDLQQHLDESSALHAELDSACQERDRQIDALQDGLAAVHAKLSRLQAGDRDREIAIAERDQELELLEKQLNTQRSRVAELEVQLTDLSRRSSAAEKKYAAASDGNRQQLEILQQRITELHNERDAAQGENQKLQTALAEMSRSAENNKTQISALEWRLGEAARAQDTLQGNLLQLENEHKQLLGSEAESTELLKKVRNQRHLAEYANDALMAARRRERWMLWTALVLLLAMLASLLLKHGVPWRDTTAQAPSIGDLQQGNRGAQPESADAPRLASEELSRPGDGNAAETSAELAVQAGMMGHDEVLSGLDDGCAQWGIADGECPGLGAVAFNESVIHLDSGVKYKVVSSGTGAAPQSGDSVVVEYRGTLLDGTEFDSSEMRGGAVTFSVDELMPGLQEALQRMEEGARWVVYVPPEHGDPEFGVPGGEAAVFDIELVSVGTTQPVVSEFASVQWVESDPGAIAEPGDDSRYGDVTSGDAPAAAAQANEELLLEGELAFFSENATREGVISLPSGLHYRVVKEGGGRVPVATDTVVLDYRAMRLDGSEFDNSTRYGQSAHLTLDELGPGLREAVLGMREGERRELYVPHQLLYGQSTQQLASTRTEPVFYDIELVSIAEQGSGAP